MVCTQELRGRTARSGGHCGDSSDTERERGSDRGEAVVKFKYAGRVGPSGGIKLRLLVTETSRNRKKKENRGKIDSHQARLLQRKESRWNIYYDVSIKNPHPNSLISINRVFSHK